MIGLSYFIDYNKRVHWMRHVEPILAKAGRFENFKVCIMLSVAAVLYFTVEAPHKSLVLISAVLGIVLHIGLELFGSFFHEDDAKSVKIKTGWAAFASLLYLEVLDASFSFDGVIGAFAITNSVLLIVAGLGSWSDLGPIANRIFVTNRRA